MALSIPDEKCLILLRRKYFGEVKNMARYLQWPVMLFAIDGASFGFWKLWLPVATIALCLKHFQVVTVINFSVIQSLKTVSNKQWHLAVGLNLSEVYRRWWKDNPQCRGRGLGEVEDGTSEAEGIEPRSLESHPTITVSEHRVSL